MAEFYRFVKGSIGISSWGTTSWPVALVLQLIDPRMVPLLLNSPVVFLAVLGWMTPPPTRTFVVERAVVGAGQLYMDITRAASRVYLDATTRTPRISAAADGGVGAIALPAADIVVAPAALPAPVKTRRPRKVPPAASAKRLRPPDTPPTVSKRAKKEA